MQQRIPLLLLFLLVNLTSLLASCKDVYMVYSDPYGNVLWTEYMYSYCIPDGSLTQPTFSEEPTGGGAEYQYTSAPFGDCSETTYLQTLSLEWWQMNPLVSCETQVHGYTGYLGSRQWEAELQYDHGWTCNSVTGLHIKIEDTSRAFPSESYTRYVLTEYKGVFDYIQYWGESHSYSWGHTRISANHTYYFGGAECW